MAQPIETVAIVPAYNEQRTVGNVVSACMTASRVDAVILVDDGSTDATPDIAHASALSHQGEKPFYLIRSQANFGKAEAMLRGFRCAEDIGGVSLVSLVFLDADLSPLSSRLTPENRKLFTRQHMVFDSAAESGLFEQTLASRIDDLVAPVSNGEDIMNIALLNRNPLVDRIRLALGWGALSGCRAIDVAMFRRMLQECEQAGVTIHGWEVEAAMNTYTRKRYDQDGQKLNKSIGKLPWPDVVNVGSRVKEGSLAAGIRRMLRVHSSALRGFIKYDTVFD